jgi:hypothetical protein
LLLDPARSDPEDARGHGQRLHSKKRSHQRPGRVRRPQFPTLRFPALTCFELVVLVGITVFVIAQLRPGLLFNPNMDDGGDNGAHVAAVYYLAHTLLPEGQVSGWDPQWFGGFPLYVFYFPLPAVLVAIIDHVFSFAVAFKLITVLGTVTLPASAYLFGRLAGFKRPTPIVMAAAMLPFLFNWSYTIYGGNIASTLAGEYSFSLACSTGLCFLGCFVYGLRTGRLRWLSALLLAVTILCHVVPALFFAGVAILFTLSSAPRRQAVQGVLRNAARVLIPIGVVGGLIAAFWLLRFGVDLRYSSSMNYGRITNYFANLFPHGGDIALPILALIGVAIAVIRLDRLGMTLGVACVGAALCFIVLPAGIAWNPRWLPFWFLFIALTAGYGVSEIGTYLFSLGHKPFLSAWVTGAAASALSICIVAAYAGVLPFFHTPASMATPLRSWVAWNYTGYQARTGWPEFSRIVTMLDKAGAKYGCGRLDYEYTPNINDMGSNIVEMSFPMWTNGCMDSMEGIYFESSTSTPFHFLDQAQLSIQPSNPSPGLPYQTLNVIEGVAHLQLEGVNYFLANSRKVEAEADVDPMLVRVASTPENPSEEDGAGTTTTASPSGPTSWVLYRILGSQLVTPLHYQPVVESGLSKTSWLSLGIQWYQAPADWAVPISESGPPSWRRVSAGQIVEPNDATKLPTVHVSDIKTTNSTVTFHVSKVGVPVLVKVPYFPNWHSAGAAAPVEVTPNDMVVVPTSKTVTLTYGTTAVDWAGRALTVAGLAALAGLWHPAEVVGMVPVATAGYPGDGTSGSGGTPNGQPTGPGADEASPVAEDDATSDEDQIQPTSR